MSLEAILLLKIPYAEICTVHDLEPASSAAQALEDLSTFIPLGTDGTACIVDMPLMSPPLDLAMAAWSFVGHTLATHDDPRGMLVVPDKDFGLADLSSYASAVAHFGDAGQWIPMVSEAEAGAASAERMQSMLGGGMASTISQIQSQLGADPRMAAMLGEGAGGGDLLQMAQQMLSQMSPAQQAQLEQMAKSMFGNLDPSALAGLVNPSAQAPDAPADDDPEFGAGDEEDPEFGAGDEPTTVPGAPKPSKKP